MTEALTLSNVLLCSLFLSGCVTRVPSTITPHVECSVVDRTIAALPPAFEPLSTLEQASSWGPEYTLGTLFGRQLDLYQSVTSFRRAGLLCTVEKRKEQIDYYTILGYYLGNRYSDVIETFCKSCLRYSDPSFKAYQDLIVILYDSYLRLTPPEREKAESLVCHLASINPALANRLRLGSALAGGNICQLQDYRKAHKEDHSMESLLDAYCRCKKSVTRAQLLNIFPGAGYWYVGQRQSAITAAVLNGLFIWATTYFFSHDQIAAGAIFASLEAGWYFGGILGAGQAAKLYNERLYERLAGSYMQEKGLFPVMELKYAF